MQDGVYIEYLMEQRIMRRTNIMDELHKIYAGKYERWIRQYLISKQILEAPLFIFCNTLYKLPDTFRIRNNSFFIGDYQLYKYLYDWNYEEHQDILVELCLKQYIESCYLNDKLDEAYWLCLTCDGLENYKSGDYFEDKTIYYYGERTGIQEEFTLVHEAAHYEYRFIDKEKETKDIREIYRLVPRVRKISEKLAREKNDDGDKRLFEECYCDAESIKFILDNYISNENIKIEDIFFLLFRTLLYIYILMYIHSMTLEKDETPRKYYDYQLWELTYRMANMYTVIYEWLLANMPEQVNVLKKIYSDYTETFKNKMKKVREVIEKLKDIMQQNDENMRKLSKRSENEKKQLIKEYLKLC